MLEGLLFDRRHRVPLNGCVGRRSPVLSDVPQGSVFGPILFVLYTSDLIQIFQSRMTEFAGDTPIFDLIPRPTDREAVGRVITDDLRE